MNTTATTIHTPPPIGAFLRPVGRGYGYCLQVKSLHTYGKCGWREVTVFDRWGMDKGRPVDDDHVGKSVAISHLKKVLPDTWKRVDPLPNPWGLAPIYYRLMTEGPAGQEDLFSS